MTRKTLPAAAAALGLALAAGSAQATVWDFSFSDTVGNSGMGQFTTGPAESSPPADCPNPPGAYYTVTGITGEVDNNEITGLSQYADSDQLLFPAAPHVDVWGISFYTTNDQYNIYEWGIPGPIGTWLLDANVDPAGLGWNGNPTSFTLTAVPEPGSWPLMIIGVGLAGASLRRRAATAVAA